MYEKYFILDPHKAYGKCKQVTDQLVKEFPHLRQVPGHVRTQTGRMAHWWCEDTDGSIVDPTAAQFLTYGGIEKYEEHIGALPTGPCYHCGEYCYDGSGFCTDECRQQYTELLNQEYH